MRSPLGDAARSGDPRGACCGQRVQAAADVGLQPDGDVVVRVDLGGEPVDVDDLGCRRAG
jgi:hypothetical protein